MVVTGDWLPPSPHTTDSPHFLLTLSILRSSSDLLPPTRKQTRFRELITLDYTIVVAASYGDHWRNLRRIGSVKIFSNHRLKSFLSIRKDEIGDLSYVSPETFHKENTTHSFDLNTIPANSDDDGLRDDGGYVHAGEETMEADVDPAVRIIESSESTIVINLNVIPTEESISDILELHVDAVC